MRFIASYYLFIFTFLALALGAAIATFIENDYGTHAAKAYVYDAFWYELLLILAAVNLLAIIFKTKLYKSATKGLLHIAFVVILIGAGLTRYGGEEGRMHIREGQSSSQYINIEDNIPRELSFSIKLNSFDMERYPGSNSPSSFSSKVTLEDSEKDIRFDYHIYMNHTLVYQGYKFFQTSYDPDEKGTVLTVNKDPGKLCTYTGYFMLFAGLLLNPLNKNSRIRILLARINRHALLLILLFTLGYQQLDAGDYEQTYFENFRNGSLQVSQDFSSLVVQSRMGRMKPMDTLSREIVRKISGKESFDGMTHNQIVLGMFFREKIWKNVPMIKIKTPKLRKIVGCEPGKLASFNQFFEGHRYILAKEVEYAHSLKPSQRGTFENDLIKVDERLNISFMVYTGALFKLFPVIDDDNNSWVDFKNIWIQSPNTPEVSIKQTIRNFIDAGFNQDYDALGAYIKEIDQYQRQYGQSVIPSKEKVQHEITYNNLKLFFRLSLCYLLAGLALLGFGFFSLFSQVRLGRIAVGCIMLPLFTILILHTIGLAVRWYISGHAPLSNTYETMIYIAYSAGLGGVIFFRRQAFPLASSFIMAGLFMFAGHLGSIDPEITNLVPVLKSFWLTVHVSVITASYGFLGIGAILGAITLVLFMLNKKGRLESEISKLTDTNEAALIIGLTLLVIGNFLGGIWANESWGRYWGWDPKETWAYISILIYAILTHLRLIAALYSKYLFACLSLLAFSSILMTYYGVNFYLSGMHSYATGDPVPIPTWVYVTALCVALLIAVSYKNRDETNLPEDIV